MLEFRLPIYESLIEKDKEKRDLDKYLSAGELLEQTERFMQNLGAKVNLGAFPGTFFFLDKGARPMAYFIGRLFPIMCPAGTLPQFEFINIGRESPNNIPFTKGSEVVKDVYGSSVKQESGILIVDEYTRSGRTLARAENLLSQAFPQTSLESMVVYSKIPHWQGRGDYVGVEEYTADDYMQMAIERLNRELGTTFSNFAALVKDPQLSDNREWMYRFNDLYRDLRGSIPSCKRVYKGSGQHELELVCQEIIRRKKILGVVS